MIFSNNTTSHPDTLQHCGLKEMTNL